MNIRDLTPFRNRRSEVVRRPAGDPYARLHDEMDRLFDSFMPRLGWSGLDESVGGAVSIDVSETDDAVEVKADLPGIDKSDVSLTLRDNALVISGERKEESEEKKKNYYRAERSYGSFSRAVALPCEVDADRVEADFDKGVLSVRLPKAESARARERRIEIAQR